MLFFWFGVGDFGVLGGGGPGFRVFCWCGQQAPPPLVRLREPFHHHTCLHFFGMGPPSKKMAVFGFSLGLPSKTICTASTGP